MKNIKFFFTLLALVFVANSCQKFDDLEADPNRSTSASPSLVLRGVLKDFYYVPNEELMKFSYTKHIELEYWIVFQ